MSEVEAFFHPALWIILLVLAIGAVLVGFGSSMADHVWGPDPAQMRQECMDRAHEDRTTCQRGILKTKRQLETCQEIYEKDVAACP